MEHVQDKTIEVRRYGRLAIFLRLFVRAVLFGGVAGGVSGLLFCGVTQFPDSLGNCLEGVPVGAAFGLGLGAINGLVLAGETVFFFMPINSQWAYRWRTFWLGMTVSCMAIAPIVRMWILDNGTPRPIQAIALFYGLIAASTFWASGRICKWYFSLWTDASSPTATLNQGDSE